MANIDLSNLTRYDGKIKEYAEDKYLSKNTANWQMTNKAGAVTCYPVPDTELEPIVDFSFKEIPPAEGDKSPSNPSTIGGVSNIGIGICGKNLFRYAKTGTYAQVSISVDADGTITLNGTCNAVTGTTFYINDGTYYTPYIPVNTQKYLVAKIEHISGSCTGVSSSNQILNVQLRRRILETGVDGFEWIYILSTDGSTAIKTWNYPLFNYIGNVFVGTVLTLIGGVSYNNYKIRVQYEFSDTLTPSNYELPIISPYTLSLGNTYYGGSVNLATGMMTVTHGFSTISSTTNVSNMIIKNDTICFTAYLSYGHPTGYSGYEYICEELPFSSTTDSVSYELESWRPWGSNNSTAAYFNILKSRLDISGAVDPSNPTNEEWKDAINVWLTSNPLHCMTSLYTPYTIQLTPMQIKSLFALDKNTPRLNTLYTDADSIQVGYQKHPARTAYELENAILALGGGE